MVFAILECECMYTYLNWSQHVLTSCIIVVIVADVHDLIISDRGLLAYIKKQLACEVWDELSERFRIIYCLEFVKFLYGGRKSL